MWKRNSSSKRQFEVVKSAMAKKNRIVSILLLILTGISFLTFLPYSNTASYSFQVDKMKTNVFINFNGSITIQYWINFTNNNWGQTMDWVDIGFPTEDYELDSVSASIDGIPISKYRIGRSTAIDIGVQVDLYGHYINPGDSAQFYIEGTNPNMIYQDYKNRSLGSVEFSPTWFNSKYCSLYEQLEVNIYFPANQTNGNLVKYHYDPYTSADPNVIIGNNHYLVYTWINTNVPMKQYYYGVSFPGEWVDVEINWSANPRLVRILTNVLLWVSVGGIVVGLGVIIYRNATVKLKKYYPPKKRTKLPAEAFCLILICAMIVGIVLLRAILRNLSVFAIIGYFVVVITGIGMIGYVIARIIMHVRKPYYKPKIMVESVGVKKDLSVVEAAIIRNTPLNKVVFLIVFSLIRTGYIKIVDIDPLKLEIVAKQRSKELSWYQITFLDAIIEKEPRNGQIDEKKLEALLISLIEKTQHRMKGHNLEATSRYYENMINKAWDSVKKLPTEIEWEDIEKEFDWIILDDQFEDRSKRYLSDHVYSHYPYWWYNYYYYGYYWRAGYYYHYHPMYSPRGITPSVPPPTNINIHSFSDSVVRGIENMSNKIVNNFSNFADRIVNATRPVAKPVRTGGSGSGSRGSGSRGYSGGGCACACACACAGCACACAGGGR